jgi:hypothetical protein
MEHNPQLGQKYKGRYWIDWSLEPNKGIREVYIAENINDVPCFERFVYVWDAKTHEYLGLCGAFWFKDKIILDLPEE